MKPIGSLEGRMAPLDKTDVDTDVIMPVQFLKHPERTGFARFLFYNWMEEPDFVLKDPRFRGASILVAGPNFGCGSSREHAPWGLQEFGFDAIVAPGFGDIFRSNCTKIGLLCAEVDREVARKLMAQAEKDPARPARIDLPEQTIAVGGESHPFRIDPYMKRMLMEGLDHIEQSLQHAEHIRRYEARRQPWLPTTTA